jgi:hypothetical protein
VKLRLTLLFIAFVAAALATGHAAVVRATGTGPKITATGPATAILGSSFSLTFATSGAVDPYVGFQVSLVYDSSKTTPTAATDLSKGSGLWAADICPGPVFGNNLGGVLTAPLLSLQFACTALGGPGTTAGGALASATFNAAAVGNARFHMYTVGPPDGGDPNTGTYTVNATDFTTQSNTLLCGGATCGGSQPWDVNVSIVKSAGPKIVASGPASATNGSNVTLTFSDTNAVTPYVGYQLSVVYDSSKTTPVAVNDVSQGPALWTSDLCPAPVFGNNMGGVLTAPLSSFQFACTALGLPGGTTGTGTLASATFHAIGLGTATFHMFSFGPPDNGDPNTGTYTINAADTTAQTNTLACGGVTCSAPWDVSVNIVKSIGPNIAESAPPAATQGSTITTTFSASNLVDPYIGYHLSVVYNSSKATPTAVNDLSVGSGLWPSDSCPAPVIGNNFGGILTAPLLSFQLGCTGSAATTNVGPLASATIQTAGLGDDEFHMVSFGPPDAGDINSGTYTINPADSTPQVNALICGGATCGPTAVPGSQPWDVIVNLTPSAASPIASGPIRIEADGQFCASPTLPCPAPFPATNTAGHPSLTD